MISLFVQNVSPVHAPDIVVFIDSITIIFEEASKGGPPLFLPIAWIESGNNCSLPNLELRYCHVHQLFKTCVLSPDNEILVVDLLRTCLQLKGFCSAFSYVLFEITLEKLFLLFFKFF